MYQLLHKAAGAYARAVPVGGIGSPSAATAQQPPVTAAQRHGPANRASGIPGGRAGRQRRETYVVKLDTLCALPACICKNALALARAGV